MYKRKLACAKGLLFVLFLLPVSDALAEEVRVAVASNFLVPLKKLSQEFKTLTGNEAVLISGSTGKLYAQIKQGAPFDVLLAADSLRSQLLEKEGIGIAGSRFTYAVGRLALWSAGSHRFAIKDLQVLKQKNFRYLAIANPKTAPYGKAAKQVLIKQGIWDQLQPRLVRGENISQTLQFVVSENAELGFVALSQLKDNGVKLMGTYWTVPADWHDPIRQQAILLKRAQTNEAAREFLNFLKSDRSQKLIESYGYSLEK